MVYTFDPRKDARWDPFVASHPDASVFCTSGWLDALARTYGYAPLAYTTSRPDEPIENAVVSCRIRSWLTGTRLVSLPFSDHCAALVSTQEDFERLLDALRAKVDDKSYTHFELRCPTQVPWMAANAQFLLHNLDLTPALPQLFRKFHVTAVQQMIRRAEKENLTCRRGTSEDLLEEFYRLMLLTRRRHHLPPPPRSWFRNLLTCLPDDAVLRVASKEGRAVAAILTLSFRDTLIYKYGCSDAAWNRLGGLAMLLWQCIQDGKEKGLRKMDFGRSDLDNSGLITFKERWGAAGRPLAYYRYPERQERHSGLRTWAGKLLSKFVNLAPDPVLTATGTVLYRHIG